MAWADTALVQVVAPANGTNNYVLADPASQGPLRTDLQAEADGSLSDGDLIHYMVRRITTTGDAEFERGYGAWTKSTRVLARTAGNVLDSDGGPGVLKDWGLSGQMDVYFLPPLDGSDIPDAATFATNLGLPRLAAVNAFTADQSFTSSTGAALTFLRDASTAGRSGDFLGRGRNASGAQKDFGRMRIEAVDLTDGAEDGKIAFFVLTAGVVKERLRITSEALLDVSGNKYDAFPSGTKMMFGTAPPSGWTRQNETQSRVIRLAKSGDTIGSTGGSDDIFDGSWTTAAHTLTVAEIASHTHNVWNFDKSFDQNGDGVTSLGSIVLSSDPGGSDTTTATGGGGSHSHNMTTPHYFIACWATKD